MKNVSVSDLIAVAIYDPAAGTILRLDGRDAVRIDAQGYGRVCFYAKEMLAHRVAWAMHHGDWPVGHIDHINGIRADNRMENLRLASPLENARNKAKSGANTSGVIGVGWHKKRKRWQAYISVRGVDIALGHFVSFEEAVAARNAAEKLHGFHENHGR